MSKPNVNKGKLSAAALADDLPHELDFSKLEYVGRGVEAMQRHAANRQRNIVLDPDVAEVFKDSASVNKALRAIMDAVPDRDTGKRRRTA